MSEEEVLAGRLLALLREVHCEIEPGFHYYEIAIIVLFLWRCRHFQYLDTFLPVQFTELDT